MVSNTEIRQENDFNRIEILETLYISTWNLKTIRKPPAEGSRCACLGDLPADNTGNISLGMQPRPH